MTSLQRWILEIAKGAKIEDSDRRLEYWLSTKGFIDCRDNYTKLNTYGQAHAKSIARKEQVELEETARQAVNMSVNLESFKGDTTPEQFAALCVIQAKARQKAVDALEACQKFEAEYGELLKSL